MFTGQGASLARGRLLRFWSATLSTVLAITLLQVAPPAKAAPAPNLAVDLVTRADGTGESVLLGESTLIGVQQGGSYRLDIQVECGLLDYIDDESDQVIIDGNNQLVSWTSQGTSVSFIGLPSDIELALDNLRIVQAPSDFGPPLNCDASTAQAWLAISNSWTGNNAPQGRAGYYLTTPSPIPEMFFRDENNLSTASPRLLQKSDGFEVEWNEYLGATGFTPTGFTLRYRDVTNSGPWIYQTLPTGDYVSAVVSGLGDPGVNYEAQIAPIVQNCDGEIFYGLFSYMANGISQFGIEPTADAVGAARTTGREVAPQCYSACTPVETTVFDGTNLATILKFTNTDPCNWTVPSNLTSTTVDAYVVGGGGGGGAAGGGGGGGGGVETSLGIAIDPGTTWTLMAGLGGPGAQDVNAIQGDSGANSVVLYPNNNQSGTIVASGGGGGGSKDQLGINSASVIRGGNGINTGATQAMSDGGSSSAGSGYVGTNQDLIAGKLYGTGGSGAEGRTFGSSFITNIFGSGGGGGAVCAQIDALNYSGGNSQNNGYGGDCNGNSQPGSRDGLDATANSGGGGGGGASDFDFGDGAGGDGATGVIYIVQTKAPTARYLPSSCINVSNVCTYWEDTTSDPDLTATITGAPDILETSYPVLNGSISSEPFPVVQGGPGGPGDNFDSITFPPTITPDSGYTLFTVARYNEKNGGQYRRIFDSAATDVDLDGIPTLRNWLSGFWGGKSGIAYHGDSPTSSYEDRNWLTPDETTVHYANWVLSTDQKNLYRSNGTQRSIESYSGGIGPGQLVVNQGSRDERSDFQIADVITFDYELSESEYQAVEAYLSGEYGICVESCSPPEITTASTLEPGDVGTAYSTTIQVNSASEVSFALSPNSSLPEGLSIDEQTGVISGIPTLDADFTFTILVTNLSNGQSTSQEFTMTVNAIPPPPEPPVFSTTSPLIDGEVGITYSQTITAISGNPISYTVVDTDNLPPGLSFESSMAEISGTPETSGTFTFTVEATDTVNLETASQEFTIFVIPLPDGPATTLRDGYTGIYYQVKTIGSGIYSINNDFSVISGDLPDGLGLSRRSGKISGTPIETGEFTFTIRLENNTTEEIESQPFTISISSDPQITPVGCEDYSESSFVPDNLWLDDNGYPIGCDMDGQESVTPVIADNEATEEVVESWSQRFDNRVNLDYFNLRNGWKCDDCSIGLQGEVSDEGPPGSGSSTSSTGLPLGFSFNYYGKTYNSVFVNSNGSLTFGAPSTCYDQTLTQIMRCGGTSGTSAIVAYGVDLDNSDLNPDVWGNPQVRHADFFYWGKTFTEDGKQAFVATWINSPGYCDGDETTEYSEFGYRYDTCDYEDFNEDPTGISYEETLSTFQIVIIDQSSAIGGVEGDADVIINYGSMQDSQNGYDSCDISRGDSSSYDEDCDPTSERYLAVGLGSTQVNAEDSELWDSSVTSLQALDGGGPGTILYNGIDASQVGDTGDFPLSLARQFEGSVPGRFEYVFRANSSPDVATIPSAPTASLGSATENSIEVTIEPPTDNGGTPVLTYEIEYRIAGETSWIPAPTDTQYAEPSATYLLSDLAPSTSYEIRVFANNGIGDSEPTETISLSTSAAPGAPETPSFSSPEPFAVQSNGQIDYSIELLSPLPDSILVRYRPTVQGTSATLPWVTETLASNAISGSTGILNPDTQYEFQVSALNSVGSSAWSESALVTSSPVEVRYIDAGGVSWMGYGSQISAALEGNGGDGLVYDGALKVFVGTSSRSTAIQIECDQSSISYPGFDVGVEGKQGHYEWETAETRVQGGYTVTCPPVPVTLSGQEVLVSLSRFFFTDSPWTRVMIDVTNLDQSEVSVGVWLESELQPELNAGDTSYEASSSSNNPVSPATGDRWVVTGDSKQSGMVVAHVFGQPLDDPNISDGVNQDGSDLMLSEFWMSVPGTSSNKQNSSRLAWFDGIVQYDVASDPNELNENYAGAVATAKTAAENFTKVKSQLTDTYPRFVPPTLTNFRMPDQIRVSPGIFHELKAARISGLAPNLDLSLNFNAGYIGGDIPVTFKISNAAKQCIDNSLNGNLFANDGNIEVDNVGLTIEGSQAELNCFIDGLSFSIPNPPIGASGTYGYLFTDLTDLTDLSSPRWLSELGTKLIFDGASHDQTLIDVEAGNATWRGVGTGINDVETRSNRNAYDEGSLEVYWIPNVDADPLTEGIEIVCPQDVEDTLLTENPKVTELVCGTDEVVTTGGPLSISITRNFATSDPWQQLELDVTNNGEEDIRGALAYRLELGSDENTEIEMTSDGDLNLESVDSWFITSDDGQRTDPVLLHYVGYEAGQKITRGTDANIDKIWVKTPLVVAKGAQVTKRYLEGVIDTPRGQLADSVIVAMRAADDLANNSFGEAESDENLNIADVSMSVAVSQNRDLPPLRIIYECRDYARNALGPIVVQKDGKVIGCDAFETNQEEGPPGPGGPGGDFGYDSINAGLFPGDQSLDENERRDAWSRTFSSVFPNAQPRLGWACDTCIVTREGVLSNLDSGLTTPELPAGLPLGFTTNIFGGSESYDSIRILPQGLVQIHDSANTDVESGQVISAFGNFAMSNGALQGTWNELPDYDFFYWGRTIYQGRVAFVITWVKIPTVEFGTSSSMDIQIGDPIAGLEPTSVQLMLVSDSTPLEYGEYMNAQPGDRATSDVDIIWNFDSIQGEQAQNAIVTPEPNSQPLFSGIYTYNGNSTTGLLSDAGIESDALAEIGVGSDTCSTATCIASQLLTNKFQSSVNGRYVMGYRDYKFEQSPPGEIPGMIAPASPRAVEVSREQADVAVISWKAPKPWLLSEFNSGGGPLAGATPILGYRIEYAENGRWESDANVFPALNQPPLLASDLISSPDGGETRYSLAIDELQPGEQYTFRVYAVYAGLDLPEPDTDLMFESEISGVPSMADERHDSALEISPVGLQENPMALDAEAIAGRLAGGLEISNATINGSTYAYGVTANSVASFTGGLDSIGFNEGLVIAPLVDARTFERGSGITGTDSKSGKLGSFTAPQERAKYENIYTEFNSFMQTQESWVPGDPARYAPVCNSNTNTYKCANGMTVLQFDVTPSADFLKFEYALAGTETGEALYSYPDGFGLFVGGIDQSHSCSLVPQVNEATPEQRFVTTANALEARLATYVPFDSDLHAATITSTMTCSADVSSNADTQTPVTVTMVIANADDQVLSPAVFLKGDSVRFENTSIQARDIPAATEGQDYEPLTFNTSGSTQPDSWLAEGLPGGMELTSSGDLTGRPTESGSFNFTVIAKDINNVVLATQAFTILVNAFEAEYDINDRFLQGQYVEVGIGGNGRFGSSGAAPSGYHPRDPAGGEGPEPGPSQRRIGFVSDRDKDGWGVGQDDGDFFVPGNPFEGFGIDVDGESYFNNNSNTNIPGVSNVTVVTSELQQSTWTSETMSNGLQVTQVAAVPVNDQRLDVTVTLTNESDVSLENVYYARQVDNDANVYACQESDKGWNSLNKVVAQANSDDKVSLVSSIMMDDCNDSAAPTDISAPHSYLGMISTDLNSVAALQGFDGFGPQQAIDFVNGVSEEECQSRGDSEMGSQCLPVMIDRGSQVFGDAGIGLGFDLGTIAAGDSETITFSYILSADQAQEIINQHNIDNDIVAPTITTLGEPALRALIGKSFESATSTWIDSSTGGSISYYTVSPELPDGLSLDSETGDISGTPMETMGETSYTLTANNLAGSSSVSFVLEIEESIVCTSNPEADLKVVLLRKISANPSTENNSTINEIDTNIAQTLCASEHIDLTLFRGGDGSPEAWDAALTGKDVLVLPATTFDLVGSNLMSYMALEEVVKPWMQDGGRVILTDGTNHIQELAELIDVTPINLETRTESDSTLSRTGSAAQALPASLAMSETNNSNISLVMNSAAVDEFYDSPKRNILDLYGDWYQEDGSYVRYGVASSFGIDRGEVSFLSSNFASDRNSAWDKVLLQTIYGTSGSYTAVHEGGTTWYPQREGGYWMESDSAARFELGYGYSKQVANCLNTPSRPSIRIVSALGTTIKCGAYAIQDGLNDGGVTLQVERFFSSTSPWMKSTINITNNDSESRYETDLVVGGSQAQDGELDIEASSFHPDGTTNLGEYLDGYGYAPETWTVASSGAGISIANGAWNYPIVAQVFGAAAGRTQGGIGRNPGEDVGDDEIKATYYLNLEPSASKTFSFFTGVVPFEAGCDRTAVAVAKQGAVNLQVNFELEGAELGADGWPTNSNLEYPSLATSSCTPFNGVPANGVAANNSSGTGVDLTWSNVQGATSYEVKYMSSGDWSPVIYVNGSAETQVSTTISGLARNTDYTFIVRAKRSNHGSYGDNSLGDFSSGILIRTAAETSSPTPTPTQSATPTPTPTPTQSVAPKPIVRKAQVSPTVPKVLKVKKTIKFTMKTKAGLALAVTSAGACKTTKITVTKKVGKKTTTTQTGWLVTATKKGNCTVTLKAKGDTRWLPMNVKRIVKVS